MQQQLLWNGCLCYRVTADLDRLYIYSGFWKRNADRNYQHKEAIEFKSYIRFFLRKQHCWY